MKAVKWLDESGALDIVISGERTRLETRLSVVIVERSDL
jgi:hypothetical protein